MAKCEQTKQRGGGPDGPPPRCCRWRWGESNPRPERSTEDILQAYPVIFRLLRRAPAPFSLAACQIIFRGRIQRSEPRHPGLLTPGSAPSGSRSGQTRYLIKQRKRVVLRRLSFLPVFTRPRAPRLAIFASPALSKPDIPENAVMRTSILPDYSRRFNARSISRRASRSANAWRLSCNCLPRANARSTLARPFLRNRRTGTSVYPRVSISRLR